MFQVNDFVTLKQSIESIEKNSVGIIEENLDDNKSKVFFVGKRIELIINHTDLEFLDITQTGKPHKNKICNVCYVLKEDFVDFEINQTDAKGRKTSRPTCKNCRVDIDGVKLITSERKRMMDTKPQKFFICPICEKGYIPDVTANIVIDHNHNNGLARDWLCDSCNTGLGRFKDDIKLLEKTIEYLKKHNQQDQ